MAAGIILEKFLKFYEKEKNEKIGLDEESEFREFDSE